MYNFTESNLSSDSRLKGEKTSTPFIYNFYYDSEVLN